MHSGYAVVSKVQMLQNVRPSLVWWYDHLVMAYLVDCMHFHVAFLAEEGTWNREVYQGSGINVAAAAAQTCIVLSHKLTKADS